MARVRSKDTKPELQIRHILTDLGFRYRLHRSELPGKPDIAFIGRKKAIFVHGCFWHGHDCKRGARVPVTNRDYWIAKITRNKTRDAANTDKLTEMGWCSLAIYECELKDDKKVTKKLCSFLTG